MSCYPPSCAVPCSIPSVGFGSCGIGSGLSYGGVSGVPASALGLTSGAQVACVSQIPASEMVIQPPSFTLVIPGPVLAASCEPLAIGGFSPCARGSGHGGNGLGYGGFLGGRQQGICSPRYTCGSPC